MEENEIKILIVDDNEINREILTDILGIDYVIITASSGEEALEILDEQYEDIMLVLQDVVLPGISGLDVLREMKKRKFICDIPVILISSEQDEHYIEEAFLLGAADYIKRPYGMAFLKKKIANCLSLFSEHRIQIHKLNLAMDHFNEVGAEHGMDEEFIVDALQKIRLMSDSVRLVDPSTLAEYIVSENGELCKSDTPCYCYWGKKRRCANCIAAKAYVDHEKHSKYEFIGNDVYHSTVKYIEINKVPFAIEMSSKADDTVFIDAFGKKTLIETILTQNKKLYIDALTGAFNRHYFEEQLSHLTITAIAMIDVDHFKEVNDTYGHLAGDEVLKSIVKTLKSQMRGADVLIRYGGDEFMIAFAGIPSVILKRRLRQMKDAVSAIRFEEYPELCITLSIGAIPTDHWDETVMKKVDVKLYEAKKTRDAVVV